MNAYKILLPYPLFLLLLCACDPASSSNIRSHNQTVQHGLQALPWPKQIEGLLGDSDHFITHFGFHDSSPRGWNSEVYFGGRFSLTMQVEVDIDYQKSEVSKVSGPAIFYLKKVKSITLSPAGIPGAKIETNWSFGETEWQKVVAAGGDWSVIGVQLGSTNPLQHFDTFVEACRSPRRLFKQR